VIEKSTSDALPVSAQVKSASDPAFSALASSRNTSVTCSVSPPSLSAVFWTAYSAAAKSLAYAATVSAFMVLPSPAFTAAASFNALSAIDCRVAACIFACVVQVCAAPDNAAAPDKTTPHIANLFMLPRKSRQQDRYGTAYEAAPPPSTPHFQAAAYSERSRAIV
jgi:hypothetical protein